LFLVGLVGLAGARLTDLRAGQDSKNSKQGWVQPVPASRTARQTTAGHGSSIQTGYATVS
jgi:hypothetical protein